VQAVAAVEHEDLERRDAVLDEVGDLVDVLGEDRRDVEAVVDVGALLGRRQHLREDLGVRARAVQVVGAGAHVRDAGRDAALG
jgi:hypothetical protein